MDPFEPIRDGLTSAMPEMVLVGPPGTGKTRAILDAWLTPAMAGSGRPGEVLACSFTRAAAGEMRKRLAGATGLPDDELRTVCRTIHSEARRLIGLGGGQLALFKDPARYQAQAAEEDDPLADGWESLAQPCRELRLEAVRLWDIARHRHPDDVGQPRIRLLARVAGIGSFDLEEVAAEVAAYEADKDAVGQIDYTDMLLRALDIDPPDRRLIIVDEAQDLSPLQIKLVRHWAARARRLVWVGDPDQGIYVFAGADGKHLTGLIGGGVPARRLHRSWRVPQAVHAEARRLILQNRDRIDAPYLPAETRGVIESMPPHSALPWLVRQVGGGSETGFVLGRTGRSLAPYAAWLSEEGYPFSQERGGASPLRHTSLVRLVGAVRAILDNAFLSGAQAVALTDRLPGRPAGIWFHGTKKDAVGRVKEAARAEGAFFRRGDLEEMGLRLANLLGMTEIEPALALIGCAEEAGPLLRIIRRCGAAALQKPPRITLTTIHSAKGREADWVVLDMEAPRPCREEIMAGREGLEAERRVLYVGITRAKRGLVAVPPEAEEHDYGRLLGL